MKKKISMFLIPAAVLLIVAAAVFSNRQSVGYQKDEGMVFGTVYSIIYQYDEDLKDEIELALKRVDSSLSMFNDSSVVSRLNRNETVELDDHFVKVFDIAQKVNEASGGAFDITVAPLVNAWGFGFKNGKMPEAEDVDSLLQIVGMQKVRWIESEKRIAKDDERIMLDCSAVAKGYGVDVVANLLRDKGIDNFMVEIGGEVVTSGINAKGKAWSIGVVKPTDDSLNVESELQTVLKVKDQAMATSGNYRNFYYKNGKKYAHTIDPATGYPVQHSLLSATVFAKDCATADAYATSFMVMGKDKAVKVLEKHPELKAYFIFNDEKGNLKTWFSPGLEVDD